MYKFLVAGAVVSTLMLIQAHAEQQKNKEQAQEARAPETENEQLKAAYEQAKKTIAEHQQATSTAKAGVNDLPLFPKEDKIEGFPAPLGKDEHDNFSLSAYYDAVAAAYEGEAHRTHKQLVRAHQAVAKQKHDQQLKAMRHADRSNPDDVTMNKSGKNTGNGIVPHMSDKHTPEGVHRDNQTAQAKRYAELKNAYEQLEMKRHFYVEMADLTDAEQPQVQPANERSVPQQTQPLAAQK